jgi:Arm DNA-binding domain
VEWETEVQFTKKLAAKAVENAKPGRHADGDGLYLIVEPSGAKRWLLYLYVKGQGGRREMGLGTWPKITLQQARDDARLHRIDAQRGTPPRVAGATRGSISTRRSSFTAL